MEATKYPYFFFTIANLLLWTVLKIVPLDSVKKQPMHKCPFQILPNGDDQYKIVNIILNFELKLDVLSSKTMGKLTQGALTHLHLNRPKHDSNKPQLKNHNLNDTKTIEKVSILSLSAQRMPLR